MSDTVDTTEVDELLPGDPGRYAVELPELVIELDAEGSLDAAKAASVLRDAELKAARAAAPAKDREGMPTHERVLKVGLLGPKTGTTPVWHRSEDDEEVTG